LCLAVPLEIVELRAHDKAVVRGEQSNLEIDVSLLPSPKVGDFVLVHAGFATETVDAAEAEQTLALLDELRDG
jgi:hydrogenase expression/formation protein HypC